MTNLKKARKDKKFFKKWKDRLAKIHVWDSSYLYDMMEFVLDDLEELWNDREKIHIIEKARLNNLKNIKILKTLIHRINQDDYPQSSLFEVIEAPKSKSKPIILNGKEVAYRLYRIFESREHQAAYEKQITREHDTQKALLKQDFELFCKIFMKHSKHFWD